MLLQGLKFCVNNGEFLSLSHGLPHCIVRAQSSRKVHLTSMSCTASIHFKEAHVGDLQAGLCPNLCTTLQLSEVNEYPEHFYSTLLLDDTKNMTVILNICPSKCQLLLMFCQIYYLDITLAIYL